jgi:hypothetical protein
MTMATTPRIESPRGSNAVNELGVEPFTSRFLSPEDLRNVASFKDDIHDKSITTQLLRRPAEFLAKFIPATVAPNALTLMSLIAVLHAFHNAYLYRNEYPRFCTAVSIVMFTLYQILGMWIYYLTFHSCRSDCWQAREDYQERLPLGVFVQQRL